MRFNAPPDQAGQSYDITPLPLGSNDGVDYVEYARDTPDGYRYNGRALRADLWVDPDRVVPGRPAILLMHGSIVDAPACGNAGRVYMEGAARDWAQRGYIVLNIDWRMAAPSTDVVKDPALDSASMFSDVLNTSSYDGDCAPDRGVQEVLTQAQDSAQSAVKALKSMLSGYADNDPEARAFSLASNRVAAMGHSLGGHLATRLALRSSGEDDSVVAAAAFSSIGDCTPSSKVRDFSSISVMGLPLLRTSSFPNGRMWGDCEVVQPTATSAPVRLYNAVAANRYWLFQWRWSVTNSPLSGSGGWGPNMGWDGIVDARWPQETCNDVNAAKGSCGSYRYLSSSTAPHNSFPRGLAEATTGRSLKELVYGGSEVSPAAAPGTVEELLRSVSAR